MNIISLGARLDVTEGMWKTICTQSVRLADPFPKDPSDPLIAATAMIEGMALVTADVDIRRSKVVETIW